MAADPQPLHWQGFALDTIIIASMTVLTALRVSQLTVFLAIVGPMVGARLTALRLGATPAIGGLAGSAVGALVIGLLTIFRRPTVG